MIFIPWREKKSYTEGSINLLRITWASFIKANVSSSRQTQIQESGKQHFKGTLKKIIFKYQSTIHT